MRLITIFSLMLIFCSCDYRRNVQIMNIDSVKVSNEDKAMIRDAARLQVEGCYLSVNDRDTLIAELRQAGDSVKGSLHFNNYEIDGSSGQVRGKLDGQIIRLWYDFESEGINSVMQVIFKKTGDSLIRGNGEMENQGDTVYFLQNKELSFTEGAVLLKTDCSLLNRPEADSISSSIR